MNYAAIYDRNWDAEEKSIKSMKALLQEQYARAIKAKQKERQPRARTKFKDLPPEIIEEIREHYMQSALYKEVIRLEEAIKVEKANHQKILNKLATKVEMKPEPCMHRVRVSSSYAYASVGFGACKYGEGVLVPYVDHLEAMGVECHIRQVNYVPGHGFGGCPSANYELWVNVPPWQFDAASRTLKMEDAVASWKKRQINPLVYNPFFGDWARL
ncbi:MAG: hypothetical protein ACYS7Y_04070 [Planctomycetota bacterium]